MKKIFITGGSGFLGQRVIARFQREHWELTALVRSESAVKILQPTGIELVGGFLEDIERWEHMLIGMDVVIHCAAPVDFWKPWEFYQQGIVDATRNLYHAAVKAGVKRFVFISSDSVLQDEKDLVDVDETATYPPEPNSFYGKAKMQAEQFLMTREDEIEIVIVRPPFIWGKDVPALLAILRKVQSKGFMWIDEGKSMFEMVHVDNAAEAIYLATFKGKPGSIYFVTDNNPQPVKEFISKLLGTVALTPPEKSISKWWASFYARLGEEIWRFFEIKKPPPITRFEVALMSMNRTYDISKISTELDYAPVVWEDDGLKEMKEGGGSQGGTSSSTLTWAP